VASDGSVYVTEESEHRIKKFTSAGVFVTKWGTRRAGIAQGSGDGQFDSPDGVAVAPDGSVYVADRYDNRIQKFTSEGVFVTKWGTYGTGHGQFSWPNDVAVAPDGSVYVADTGNHRIQRFKVGP